MNILLVQREGIDLYHTFFASETSRLALRFYHPKKKPCGVLVTLSTLGSALSLVSEMRWYIGGMSGQCSSRSPPAYSAPNGLHRTYIMNGHRFSNLPGHSGGFTGSAGGTCQHGPDVSRLDSGGISPGIYRCRPIDRGLVQGGRDGRRGTCACRGGRRDS